MDGFGGGTGNGGSTDYGAGPGGSGTSPAYLHALSDLRAARHYLNDGWAWEPVRHDDNAAIRQIDAAINEIKQASIDDGKGLNDPFTHRHAPEPA